jgi:hypothetical protein
MQNYTFGGKINILGTEMEQVIRGSQSVCLTPKNNENASVI